MEGQKTQDYTESSMETLLLLVYSLKLKLVPVGLGFANP